MPPSVRSVVLGLAVIAALAAGCGRKSASTQGSVQPLMWAIEKDGHTSYLLGTMHTGIEPERLPPQVWDRLAAARVLAVETDLSGAAAMPVLRTDGSSLRDELGPAYWSKLEDVLGVGEASRLAGFKPMIAVTIVATHGLPVTASIDGTLEERARARGTPIVYLERLEKQFAVLEKWLDIRALRDLLDDIDEVERTSKDMLAAFVAGDETGVAAILTRERARWLARGHTAAEYDAQIEDVLYRRNASWIPAIEKLHADGGGLIAVGAAHTVGPRSVTDLLGQRGYKVIRVTR